MLLQWKRCLISCMYDNLKPNYKRKIYSSSFIVYLLMNSAKLNGINTQQLSNLMNTLMEKPDTSKATFFVKTEWNGMKEDGDGFCVRTSCKDFQIGNDTVQRRNNP